MIDQPILLILLLWRTLIHGPMVISEVTGVLLMWPILLCEGEMAVHPHEQSTHLRAASGG